MRPRAPIALRVGDRCMVQDRLAEVEEITATGMVSVVFVHHPWMWAIVPASFITCVGFGETVREPVSPLERMVGVRS